MKQLGEVIWWVVGEGFKALVSQRKASIRWTHRGPMASQIERSEDPPMMLCTVGEKDQVAISRFEVSRVHVPEAPPHNFLYVITYHTIFRCNLLLKSHKILDPRTA